MGRPIHSAKGERMSETVERWTFGGTRLGSKNERFHLWIDEQGVRLLFKPEGSPVVGGIYEVRVTRHPDKVSFYPNSLKFTGEKCEQQLLESLTAHHRAALSTLELISLERAAKKDDPLENAITHLCRMAGSVPARQRHALIGYIIHRLNKSWYL